MSGPPELDYELIARSIHRAPSRYEKRFAIDTLYGLVEKLQAERNAARFELEQLRAGLGKSHAEWGVRVHDDDPDQAIEPMSSLEQARHLAAAWTGEIEGSSPTAVTRRHFVSHWCADATEETT